MADSIGANDIAADTERLEKAIGAVRSSMKFVSSRLINREEIIEQIFFAILTGEHALLQSRTGAGKTLLADQIFAMFTGCKVFKVQASKEQQPETYFGGLDIERLKSGKIFHNTEGSLVESEFGFIDEIFDANDFTLRSLLSLLNERALIRGVQNQPARTHTVIAATNYLRVTEVTEAILDRFLYKAVILPDKNPFHQFRIAQKYLQYSGGAAQPAHTMPFADVEYLYRVISGREPALTVTMDADVLYFANLVIRHYEYARNRTLRERSKSAAGGTTQDYYVSPRTQAKALDLLRALALLDGRMSVNVQDIDKLYLIFTTLGMSDEREAFAKSYSTLMNTLSVSNGFHQLKALLSLAEVLERIRVDSTVLETPLTQLEATPVRRTLVDWLKSAFTPNGQTADQNKRLLEGFLKEFIPVCDEIRELKQSLESDMRTLFSSDSA